MRINLHNILLFLFLILLSENAVSGNRINTINCEADFFTVDNLENIYLVKGVSLTKLNPDGSFNSEFSDHMLGDISSVDVTDPLRVLLFYREHNQILFLDNRLSKIASSVSLDDLDIFSSNAVCVSAQNHFWVYDDQSYQLLQFTSNRELSQESTPLDQIINDFSSAQSFFERGNYLYLKLEETGVLIFDSFGSYYKTYPRKGISSFQVSDNYYFYIDTGRIMYYDRINLIEKEYIIGIQESINQICINKNNIYVLLDDKLVIEEI